MERPRIQAYRMTFITTDKTHYAMLFRGHIFILPPFQGGGNSVVHNVGAIEALGFLQGTYTQRAGKCLKSGLGEI